MGLNVVQYLYTGIYFTVWVLTVWYLPWYGFRVELAPGVEYVRTADVKDQIELSGNDIQAVSMTGKPFPSHFGLHASCVCALWK